LETKDLLLVLLPIISGIAGSYLTYYLTRKTKRDEAILHFKEEKYAALLVLLQGFVGTTTSGELKRKFFEEQYKSWIYSSDNVVRAINQLVKLVIDSEGKAPDLEKGREAVGNIVLAMRKDLLGKTQLTHFDFRYTDVIGKR
jgi:signal recognition particle GTPase